MPIDYSKFNGIGDDSDAEDEKPRGNLGGEDFERLLQECLQQEAKAAGQQPDAYAARGLGGWGGHSGQLGPPPPPPPPCGPDPYGPYGDLDAYDPYGALDGGLGGFDDAYGDGLGSSRKLDLDEFRAEAWRLLCGRLAAAAGPAAAVPRGLLLEAEVHLLSSRHRQALVAALAAQLATADAGPGAAPEPSPWAAPTLAVEMICSYQLGDRDRALELRAQLQQMDRSTLSQHLAKRFDGTCEVLDLMPQFLNLLRAAEQEQAAEAAS